MTLLSDTEIPYSGDINENPGMSGVIDAQINEHLTLIEFQREFKEQYLKFESLGFNIFKAYNYVEMPMNILEDFLEHVHVHILSIPDYDVSNIALAKREFIIRALYEILIIDIPTKHILDLPSTNANAVRDALSTIYSLEIDILSKATKEITWAQLKAHFAQDLFDNNLERFLENYILPMKNIL